MKITALLIREEVSKKTGIKLQFYKNRNRYTWGTGLSILPSDWNFKTQRPKIKKKKSNPNERQKELELMDITNKLDICTVAIKNYITKTEVNNEHFDFNLLKTELNDITKPELSQLANPIENTDEKLIFIKDYTKEFIERMESGDRRNPQNENIYSFGTIKNYRQFLSFWKTFEKSKRERYRFKDIDLNLHNNLISYCNRKNYKTNYTGRIIKQLKSIIKNAYRDGIHNNEIFKDERFKVLKAETDSIALSEKEVQLLYELDLSNEKRLERLRDVFLVECYTALRFSDASKITPEHVAHNEDTNRNEIHMFTKKTSEKVIIPIRPELEHILSKYEYHIPKVFEQDLNSEIKIIAKRAGIHGNINTKETIGGKVVYGNKQKHELITTHTGRRTAATLMYLAGINPIDIMKITGHTTEKNFMKYIKTDKQQTSNKLSSNKFFMGNNLKAI
ncbi:site-specific integrase [Membranihabitans marinus]|uniref:site-specific integrase n=1 Tax=Membranihabitans marinus TaxID=1227546 RepID=UPI001F2F308B|nr:site-specific integrase [Membranihabitans marinus]